jgi:hypothetical protein
VPPLHKAGIVDTLVATLSHKSPHCVAAAAGNLYVIDGLPGGQAVVGASGAIPALVGVLKRAHMPNDHETDTVMGQRCEHISNSVCVPHMTGYESVRVWKLPVIVVCTDIGFPGSLCDSLQMCAWFEHTSSLHSGCLYSPSISSSLLINGPPVMSLVSLRLAGRLLGFSFYFLSCWSVMSASLPARISHSWPSIVEHCISPG